MKDELIKHQTLFVYIRLFTDSRIKAVGMANQNSWNIKSKQLEWQIKLLKWQLKNEVEEK